MPADPICKIVLSNGLPCGYQAQGDTPKATLADLFRHQAEHLKHITTDSKGTVTVHQ